MTITQEKDQQATLGQNQGLPIAALQDWLDSAKSQSNSNNGDFWSVRASALSTLDKQGLPNGKKLERWKYSPLQKVWQTDYFAQFLDNTDDAAANDLPAQQDAQNAKTVTSDSSLESWNPKNAIVLPLYEGKCAPADLARIADVPGISIQRAASLTDTALQSRLNSQLQALGSADGMCATTLALATDTIVITLSQEFDAQQPLVIHHQKRAADAASADYTTFAIRLESQQKITLIEQYHAQAESQGLKSVLSLIDLAPNAHCEHLRLLTGQASVQQHFYTRIILDASSQYHAGNYTVGNGFIRSVMEPQLSAPGAHCQINGAYLLACDKAHHDHRIFVDHLAPHCTSDSFVKGIAGKGATAVFNGRIHIAPGAKQSDGALQNRNLLMDNKSTIHTKPELEIYNDDVKCSHGATVSQLDHQQLLYLQSRGLDSEAAVHLLLESYLLETLQGLPESFQAKALKQWLISALDKAIPGANAKEIVA